MGKCGTGVPFRNCYNVRNRWKARKEPWVARKKPEAETRGLGTTFIAFYTTMMAAESGGLPWPRSKDVSLKFSAKPNAAVYLPSLNCIVGTVSDGFIEVLDIHSGCLLRKVNCAGKNGPKFLHVKFAAVGKLIWKFMQRENMMQPLLESSVLQETFHEYFQYHQL